MKNEKRFTVKDNLTEEEIRYGLRNVIKDGLTSQAMGTLTGGIFLVAFALKLGASNMVIGLLAAIPSLAQLIQIPSVYLVEKYRIRRPICVYSSALSRIFWLLIALIPFMFSLETGLAVLIVALLLQSALGGIGGCGWNSWMRDLVPHDCLGSFFSKRMSLAAILGSALSLAAGFYLDRWKNMFPENELYGYSILFFFGFLAGMLGVYFIARIPEPSMAPLGERLKLSKLITQPFQDTNFRNLIMALGPWNFAVNLASPFFTVYMLKSLQLNMSFIIALTVLSQITNLAFLRIWGRFSDRFSNKSVLTICGTVFMLTVLAWTFTAPPQKSILTIPLLIAIHIFTGISNAGISLTSGNIGFKLAPKGKATGYLASMGIVNSLSAGIAPVLGGIFADFFTKRQFSWTMTWTGPENEVAFQVFNLHEWGFFFFFAFLIGLYAIHRLTKVKEPGEVEERVIIYEFIYEVGRSIKAIIMIRNRLRYTSQFALLVVRNSFRRLK
ncbi:MAG: MFS transporter [Candidatus Methanoperedens sp.]|nr:MFS transporter [Candidatus Methanoperedens sp.]